MDSVIMIDETGLLAYCKRVYCRNNSFRWLFWKLGNALRGMRCGDHPPAEQEPCDVLVLHPSEKSFNLGRKQKLIDRLRASGVSVLETVALYESQILQQKATCGPYRSGRVFSVHEGYANWLKRRYPCKVMITDRNGSILSPFLKAQNDNEPKTFHLAHSVTTAQSSRFSMLDYDYYCIYGRSSYEYLTSLPDTYGECRFVLGGSVLFDEQFKVSGSATPDKPVLFLGAGPEMEATDKGKQLYRLVADWQARYARQLLIRLHQRSTGEFWKTVNQAGIEVLPSESFEASAARCSMVLSPYTNAVVDAAMLGRPSQLIARPDEKDFLQVERFFGPRASTTEQIEKAVENILGDFENYTAACQAFARYHVEHGGDSVAYISQVIQDLVAGKHVEGFEGA